MADRAALLAAAKAKLERQALLERAKAKLQAEMVTPSVDEAADVSLGDRAIAKNFATKPETQAAFIKKQYPGAEVRVTDGEVEIKMPKDKSFKRLDPSGLDWGDIVDIPYDIAAGIAQGAATFGGGALGAVGGPLGAGAGAMAASAASGGALETARQWIGQQAGIPQDMDWGQVGMNTAVGAASPVVFGAGKVAPAAIARYAAAKGITNEAAEQALTQGTRGLVERSYDGVTRGLMPRIMSGATGVSADSIRYFGENPTLMQNLKETGITGDLQKMSDTVTDWGDNTLAQKGKAIQTLMDTSGKKVNTTGAKQAFLERIAKLESKQNKTNADLEEIKALRAAYSKYIQKPVEIEEVGSVVLSPERQLNAGTDQINQALDEEYTKLTKDFINRHMVAPSDAQRQQLQQQAQARVAQAFPVIGGQPVINTKRIEPKLYERDPITLQNRKVNYDLPDELDSSEAFDLQKKLKQIAKFDKDMTPESASVQGSAQKASRELNRAFDEVMPSQAAKDDYAQMLDINDLILPKFKDAQTTYNTVIGMDRNTRQVLKEKLKDLEKTGQLDIAEDAKRIKAFSEFYGAESSKKAPLAAIAGTIGSLLGYNTGGGYAAAAMGGVGGTAAGATLGSRPMLEAAIKKGISLEQLGRMAQPKIGYGAVANPIASQTVPWMLMRPQED